MELVMPSNHLILCHPLLLLPSMFPSIRVFSSESVLHIRWPKNWSFSFSISPSIEYSGLIFGSPCIPRDSQESLPTPQFKSINSALSFLYSSTLLKDPAVNWVLKATQRVPRRVWYIWEWEGEGFRGRMCGKTWDQSQMSVGKMETTKTQRGLNSILEAGTFPKERDL